jgi:addiction module toxin, txe/yoeB family
MMEKKEDKYELIYSDKFFEHIEKHKKSGQKKSLIKVEAFLSELEKNPTEGTGKPEELKGYRDHSVWSRRIDQKHRLTYEIFEEQKEVVLLTCYGHYEDK